MSRSCSLLPAWRLGDCRALLPLAFLLAYGAAALASPADDLAQCQESAGSLAVRIAACSRVIDAATLPDRDLAAVHANRGVALVRQGNAAQAVADFDTAIALSPQDWRYYINRGSVFSSQGELDRAVADFNQAIQVAPAESAGLTRRGTAFIAKRDFQAAIADLDAALRLNPRDILALRARGFARFNMGDLRTAVTDFKLAYQVKADPQSALWLYVAQARQGSSPPDELLATSVFAASEVGRDKDDWPGPIIQLLSGLMTPAELQSRANDGDARVARRHACQASFFRGQWRLIHKEIVQAKADLAATRQLCEPDAWELTAAVTDLSHLR